MDRVSESLLTGRRYAIVAFFVVGILLRHDAIGQLSITLPLIGFYEIAIWYLRLMDR
jgi:Sec-independent protein secretion pathway component TatC